MTLLEKHIWKSHIRADTKVRFYQTYVLPVLVYSSQGGTITKGVARRLDAFDTRSLRKKSFTVDFRRLCATFCVVGMCSKFTVLLIYFVSKFKMDS